MPQAKNELGRFVSKSVEERAVRSIRATESVWNQFGIEAENRGITRADLLELMVESKGFELTEFPCITQEDKQTKLRCNTQVDINRILGILKDALTLKSNSGGAIKAKIREVIVLIGDDS